MIVELSCLKCVGKTKGILVCVSLFLHCLVSLEWGFLQVPNSYNRVVQDLFPDHIPLEQNASSLALLKVAERGTKRVN